MTKARWKIKASFPKVDPDNPHLMVVELGDGDYVVPQLFEATAIRDDVTDWPPITMQIAMDGTRPTVRKLTIGSEPFIEAFIDGAWTRNYAGHTEAEFPYRIRHAHEDDLGIEAAPTRQIDASLLRELPLARLAKHAMLGVAWRYEGPRSENVVPYELRDVSGFYRLGPEETELEDDYGVYIFDEPAWDDHWTPHMETLAKDVERRRAVNRRNRITDELLARVASVYREAIEEDKPPKKAVAAALNVAESTAGRYIGEARKKGHLRPTAPGKKGELPAVKTDRHAGTTQQPSRAHTRA
jgi:hypothetical protein